LGSAVIAKKPGDGSAREQAASCQRVLGGIANIALEYATKRYRSNLINWGMLPLLCKGFDFKVGDYIYIENIADLIKQDSPVIGAKHISGGKVKNIYLEVGSLTEEEKKIILSGCLINYNKVK
jgi:aconitate hydratase